MTKHFSIEDVPRLDDWIGIAEFATVAGISRQYAHKIVRRGDMQTVRKLGNDSSYVVSEAEAIKYRDSLATLAADRERAAAEKAQAAAEKPAPKKRGPKPKTAVVAPVEEPTVTPGDDVVPNDQVYDDAKIIEDFRNNEEAQADLAKHRENPDDLLDDLLTVHQGDIEYEPTEPEEKPVERVSLDDLLAD